MIQDDPYIQKLKIFVPAGDLPQLRDALIVLRQVKQGLSRVSNTWDTNLISERLKHAHIVKLAVEYALDGENSISTLRRIKNESDISPIMFPEEWEIKEDYSRESAFNFKRLDSIDIQEYFKVE